MRLPFDADQATYDAWAAFHAEHVDNVNFFQADYNDMVYVFMAGRKMAERHPELIDRFIEHGPEAVERAGKELGMFMGAAHFAKLVGLDPKEGHDAMVELVRGS